MEREVGIIDVGFPAHSLIFSLLLLLSLHIHPTRATSTAVHINHCSLEVKERL